MSRSEYIDNNTYVHNFLANSLFAYGVYTWSTSKYCVVCMVNKIIWSCQFICSMNNSEKIFPTLFLDLVSIFIKETNQTAMVTRAANRKIFSYWLHNCREEERHDCQSDDGISDLVTSWYG